MKRAAPPENTGVNPPWRILGAGAAFIVPFLIYLYTLAPSFEFEDAVEFVLGAATLGVNHPSGYPAETLWGHLFTYVPVGGLPWRVNLASASAAALAAFFVFLLAWDVLGRQTKPGPRAVAGWSAAALCAFGRTFWSQAVIAEVYALNALFLAVTLWCGFRGRGEGERRWFFATAFVAGLAAANHPSSLLLTASLLVYLARTAKRGGVGLLVAALFALLGASVYLYIPLRAAREPLLNWGTAVDLGRLGHHVGRYGYGPLLASRLRFFVFHARELGAGVIFQFGPGVGLLAIAGAVALWRRPYARLLLAFAALAGPVSLVALVAALNPIQIEEMEVWFIPFFFLLAFFAGAALGRFAERGTRRALRFPLLAVAILLPLIPLIYNFRVNNHRTRRFASEHARNVLRSHGPRAISAFPFPNMLGIFEETYLLNVEGQRPDVDLLDASRNVKSGVRAGRGGPSLTRDGYEGAAWWAVFMADLTAREKTRPVHYNVKDPRARGWGARQEPSGLIYLARAQGAPSTLWPPAWDRFEYTGLNDVGRDLAGGDPVYAPPSRRTWARYYLMRAEGGLTRGEGESGWAALAVAENFARDDGRTAWAVASIFASHGRPEKALPYYRIAVSRLERYRYDLPVYRNEYVALLNALGTSYMLTGEADEATRYFRYSLTIEPDQPELDAYLRNHGF